MGTIIKKFSGVEHVLIHSFIAEEENYKYSYWENMRTKKVITLRCHLPEGIEDIDLSTLKPECLFPDENKTGTNFNYIDE